jgi:hypothetical protein
MRKINGVTVAAFRSRDVRLRFADIGTLGGEI